MRDLVELRVVIQDARRLIREDRKVYDDMRALLADKRVRRVLESQQ